MFPVDAGLRDTITAHYRRNNAFVWSEDFFLTQIASASSKYDVYWATIALRDCGTALSVPPLKSLSAYSMQDVKGCAILTIAQIAGSAETPYYVERLLDPKGTQQLFALWAIGVAGDERALPAVVQYIRKYRKKLAAASYDPREQQEVLAYLHRMKAKDLLEEFSFLAAPLRSLAPVARTQFMQRVPAIEAMIKIPSA